MLLFFLLATNCFRFRHRLSCRNRCCGPAAANTGRNILAAAWMNMLCWVGSMDLSFSQRDIPDKIEFQTATAVVH